MTTPGPIALLGGSEHRDVTRPIDRWLLERTGARRAQVAVVPVASSRRKLPSTAALARTYWRSLGADVSFVVPDPTAPTATLDALGEPDLVVLTGGVPSRLIASLGASILWDRILQLWHDGTAISGSSAGSMALFDWRLNLYPPHPFRLVPGLGPLTGYLSLPHFDRYVAQRPRQRHILERVTADQQRGIIGIDEGTAIVGRDTDYLVLGRGAVTVLDAGKWTTYPTAATVDLRLQPSTELRLPPRIDHAAA